VRLRGEHVCRGDRRGPPRHGAPYIVMEYLEGSDLAERAEEASGPCRSPSWRRTCCRRARRSPRRTRWASSTAISSRTTSSAPTDPTACRW
jgi:hypothetical protein